MPVTEVRSVLARVTTWKAAAVVITEKWLSHLVVGQIERRPDTAPTDLIHPLRASFWPRVARVRERDPAFKSPEDQLAWAFV